MRAIMVGLVVLSAAAPALACQCIEPQTAAEKQEIAAQIASQAVAVADVELISSLNQAARRGEIYRVLKVHVGRAPAKFELDRWFDGAQPVMTSCDVAPPPGQRATVVLYATKSPRRLTIGGTCDHIFVNSPGALDLIRAQSRKLAGAAVKG